MNVTVLIPAYQPAGELVTLTEALHREGFRIVVVDDGSFCAQSAQLVGCSREWIDNVLKKEKCLLRDVFLLTANTEKKYRLVRRE